MNKILVLAAFAATSAFAQTYPSKPIHLIVPFPPGGASDLTARTLGQKMGENLGQPVVIDNKPGANGVVGIDVAAKSPPDGYTLLLTDRGSLTVNPWLYQKLAYDPVKDFAYVGIITNGPYVLVANPKLGVGTVKDLVALSKAKPGTVNYASYGVGSMAQLNLEAFNQKMGTDMVHVPYKGAVTIATVPAVQGFIKDGRLRALAVGSDKRFAVLPDVPTMTEAGAPNDILLPTYFALLAPAGTPAPIVERLNAEMKKALADPQVVERLASAGLVPNGGSPEAMAASIKEDLPRFQALVKSIGIKPE
jgi:tripartite-type tricarboxylate transporter receptor subunit TctC